jgi:MinD superfamily P-loop ATPase
VKTVTVASGKGGTGKTTLSALLARLASETIAVAIADADVEASNLPLALRVEHAGCDSFAGGMKARIDRALCTDCGACVPVCRFGAILVREGSHEIDTAGCEGCTACARICPTSAINMERQQAGEVCTGLTEVGPIAYGQLRPGHDLSGKLVTEVRSRAVALGAVHGSDLLLIDGPPGTGCPAIASVTGTDLVVAVTEPTKSGVHDLGRLEELVRRFGLPLVVVLNKADLSASGSREVRALCAERNLALLAEIPFDPMLASALQRMAEGTGAGGPGHESRGMSVVREVWRQLSKMLGMASPGFPVI